MIKDLRTRVVELGKIKIGMKGEAREGKSWRMPKKLDHFLITGLERDALGNFKVDTGLMNALIANYGSDDGKLREIPIALLDDEIESVFQTAYVAYVGRKCVARSDGETITWFADPKNGWAPLKEPIVAENKNDYVQNATIKVGNQDARLFKPNGILNVVIADGGAKWGGVYKLRTTSIITIEQIYSGLQHVQALTGGFLRNVPLRLVVRPMEVAPDGMPTTVYVVHVEIRGTDLSDVQQRVLSLAQAEIRNTRQLREVRQQYVALLKAPGEDEGATEQSDVNEEFSPETVEAESATVIETTATPAPDSDDDGELSFGDDEAEEAEADELEEDDAEGEKPDEFVDPATGEVYEGVEAPFFRAVLTAKNADELKAVQDQVKAAKDVLDSDRYEALKTAYYATRERLTGKPPPAEQAAKAKTKATKRTAPKQSAPAPEKAEPQAAPKPAVESKPAPAPAAKPAANDLMNLPF